MTRYLTKGCDCPDVVTGTGGKRPEKCACGKRFYTENQLASAPASIRPPARQFQSQESGVDSSTLQARRPFDPDEAHSAAVIAVESQKTHVDKKPRRRKGRSEPKRDWTLARAKIDEEGGLCRVCAAFSAEAAHILGRKYDQPTSPGSKTLLVLPDRIVPLCSEQFGHGCHACYDAHELDLLPYLTAAEQAQAVLDAGSMGLALKRISPMLELAA